VFGVSIVSRYDAKPDEAEQDDGRGNVYPGEVFVEQSQHAEGDQEDTGYWRAAAAEEAISGPA